MKKVMRKVNVRFVSECRNLEFENGVCEIVFRDERDFVKKCLLEEFDNDKEGIIKYWSEYCGLGNWLMSMNEVIDEVIENKEVGKYWLSEEGYVEMDLSSFKRV